MTRIQRATAVSLHKRPVALTHSHSSFADPFIIVYTSKIDKINKYNYCGTSVFYEKIHDDDVSFSVTKPSAGVTPFEMRIYTVVWGWKLHFKNVNVQFPNR